MMGLPDDLREIADSVKRAISAAGFMIETAKDDARQATNLDLQGAFTGLRSSVLLGRQAVTPRVACELIEAQRAFGVPLPTYKGCEEQSATGLALAIAQMALDSFVIFFRAGQAFDGSLTPPASISGVKEFQGARPRLRLLAVPDIRSLCRLIDREVDAVAMTRGGIGLQQTARPVTEPGAAAPVHPCHKLLWKLLIWVVVVLFVAYECTVALCVWKWGAGENFLQKASDSWGFFVAGAGLLTFTFRPILRFLLGRKRRRLL